MSEIKNDESWASGDDHGAISKNEAVRNWVLSTPKCPKCGFFVMASFSGLRNEFVWPICSNKKCSLHRIDTFIRPEMEMTNK